MGSLVGVGQGDKYWWSTEQADSYTIAIDDTLSPRALHPIGSVAIRTWATTDRRLVLGTTVWGHRQELGE